MRIERRYTKTGQSPYAEIPFRLAVSEIRNPDGSVVFRQDGIEVPAEWSQVATDVLAQKYFRKAGVPARLKKVEENAVPSWLWRSRGRREGAGEASRGRALRRRAFGEAGLRPARRLLDLLGLEGRLFLDRGGRPRLLRRAALHAGAPDVRAELAAMVQHRPALGLRHRRAGAGPLLRRPPDRRADAVGLVLRAPAAARLLHPVVSPTTSSTRAASWICGCARRACSSTAPAPAPISRRCAARASGSRAAGAPPG